MKMLSLALIALVGTMMLGLPIQSYADPQLDTLLSIATQARDNIGTTISQTNNVPNEINQLYKQGSTETDELAKAVAQQDANSAKQHFLAAMKFFKETNDQINSLNATTGNNQQQAEIVQLRGEIVRLDKMENLLKTIATNNSIDVNFTKFDALIQTAQQDLDAGNVDDATTAVKNANDFLVQTHNSLTTIAQERIAERAKDFTEKQIERFSKMNGFNATNSTTTQASQSISTPISPPITPPSQPPPTPPTVPANTTAINATNYTLSQPPPTPPTVPANTTAINATNYTLSQPPTPPIPSQQSPTQPTSTPISPPITPPSQPPPTLPTIPVNSTAINATNTSVTLPQTISVQNNSSIITKKNPQELLAELRKLMSEGKINEALKVIKLIEAYQKKSTGEQTGQLSPTSSFNSVENLTNNTSQPQPPPIKPSQSSTTPLTHPAQPPITPPSQPLPTHPTVPANTTAINATNSPTSSNTISSTPNGHETSNPEKGKYNKEQRHNDKQNSNSKDD